MRSLNGKELSGYIKERQAKQVRQLRQAHNINPKLAIIATVDNPVINTYLRLKKRYGSEILVDVDVYRLKQENVKDKITKLNNDQNVHAIIIQLPLEDPSQTDEIVNMVSENKDVDGLGLGNKFDPATPLAIMWLLTAYNIELTGKEVLLVGHGRLVGAPLNKMLLNSGITPNIADKRTKDLKKDVLNADVVITATGVGELITPDMLKPKAVVVDAGLASEGGKTLGDVARTVYEQRDDLTITPIKGGVGPLTVSALFENVIQAARMSVKQ